MDFKEAREIIREEYRNGHIHVFTDGDILDIAKEYRISNRQAQKIIFECFSIGTSCENCKNIMSRYYYSPSYPCNKCSRINDISDYYEKDINTY